MRRDRAARKLIAVIRDPVDRAYSNWTHLRSDGLEPEADFRAACALEEQRAARGWAPFWRYLGPRAATASSWPHLFEHFPREQVHVLRYRRAGRRAGARPSTTSRAFLGVETGVRRTTSRARTSSTGPSPASLNTGLRYAVRGGAALGGFAPPQVWRQAQRPLLAALQRGDAHRPSLDVEVRRELVDRFRDDIAQLERLLGRDVSGLAGRQRARHVRRAQVVGAVRARRLPVEPGAGQRSRRS